MGHTPLICSDSVNAVALGPRRRALCQIPINLGVEQGVRIGSWTTEIILVFLHCGYTLQRDFTRSSPRKWHLDWFYLQLLWEKDELRCGGTCRPFVTRTHAFILQVGVTVAEAVAFISLSSSWSGLEAVWWFSAALKSCSFGGKVESVGGRGSPHSEVRMIFCMATHVGLVVWVRCDL
jgi:hypothetical protein